MKKLLILIQLLAIPFFLPAQSGVKKYVLLEHFTNSNCSVCASRNPAFFNLIGQPQYVNDVHHVSIHPPYPYAACVFYQANTVDNNAWAALYGIQGTPRVAVNGNLMPGSSQLLRVDSLNRYVGQTSPLLVKVTEAGTTSRNVKVEVASVGQVPPGNYKLFAAIVEKTINQTTPNTESVHHNVFRDMITPVDGADFNPPAPGETAAFNYSFNVANGWNASEIYVLAFVKNVTTGQVMNSGTKFDAALSGGADIPSNGIRFSPNPVSNRTTASIGDDTALHTDVFDIHGKRVFQSSNRQPETVTISTENMPRGVYFVRITGEKGLYTAKFVKE